MNIPLYVGVHIKTIPWNVCIFHLRILELSAREICKFLKNYRLIFNIFSCFWIFVNKLPHILRRHISKNKRCFNLKSSANYFHMKTKTLADFQICISGLLKFYRVSSHIFFNMRYFRLQIFEPCYGTQRNHILAETGTQVILWKTFLWNIAPSVCKFSCSSCWRTAIVTA